MPPDIIQGNIAMSFLSFKLLTALAIFIVTLSAGWLPFVKRINTQNGVDFPIGEALASGVFLGVGLLHMLSDASQGFAEAGYNYPFASLLAGAMFLFLLWLEHLGRDYYQHEHGHGHSHDDHEHHHELEHSHDHKTEGSRGKSFAILALAMLSLHAFLESAALGLSTNFTIILMLAIAILAHKWAESFALAIQLTKSTLSSKMGVVYFLLFALVAPIGIFLGGFASEKIQHLPLLGPTFVALASGTFLYLGTLHGLSRAVMVQQCCNLKQYTFVIIGFSLMAIVAVWT